MLRGGLQFFLLMLVTLFGAGVELARGEEVAIALEHFGVGDHVRPGDLIGAEFSLSPEVDQSTPIELVWELPDGNGDIAQVSRLTVVNPGQVERVWLYARIPPTPNAAMVLDTIFTVRVWEFRDGARVRQLGSARVSGASCQSAPVAVDLESDLIGVVGNGRMGLDVFATPAAGLSWIPSMNVVTQIARGLKPQTLPDQWEGLSPYQSIIWSEGDPKALSADCASALREWVFRGGNLVIVLPEIGEYWGVGTAAKHPLADLMPKWKVEREKAFPVSKLLPLLSRATTLLNPRATLSVAFFTDPPAKDPYQPLLLMPVARDRRTGLAIRTPDSRDGGAVALARTFGHGSIAVIGIDVDALYRRSLTAEGLPRGDVFWNRILARRADTPSPAEYSALKSATPSRLVVKGANLVDLGRGELVNGSIGMFGRAALGVMGAFLLFVLYWTLAGPGGFALLRWRGWERHSWVAFIATAMAFGVSVWAIGGSVGSSSARAQHLTVLDSIWRSAADEPAGERILARATSWFSIFLPGYSATTVSIGTQESDRNILTAWSPPPGGSASVFPNPAIAAVPMSAPESMRVNARSTSASFEAQWIGSLPKEWGRMPYCSDPERPLVQSVLPGDPIRVSLTGLIEHRLPGVLRNVHFIHVTPIRNEPGAPVAARASAATQAGHLPNIGRFQIVPEWPPSAPLEIAQVMYPGGAMAVDETEGSIASAITARYRSPFAIDIIQQQFGSLVGRGEFERFLDMLSIYSMLDPPSYLMNPPPDEHIVRVNRMLGRSIDISQWLSRPCLIVWGYLDQSSSPVPISVDGEAIPSDGTILVRTVLPLPAESQFAAPGLATR